MSHTFGAMCSTHEQVMTPDGACPERGCEGHHGYTYMACDDRCPMHQVSLEEENQ